MSEQPDLSDPRVARALANPRRHTLLAELATPGTMSQLAVRLGMNKGSVSHHLRILLEAGLVHRASSRTVRGGTEIYYERTMSRWTLPSRSTASSAATAAMVHSLASDPQAHVHQRTLNLTRQQARQVAAHLDRFLESLEPAKGPAPIHTVVIAIHSRQPLRKDSRARRIPRGREGGR